MKRPVATLVLVLLCAGVLSDPLSEPPDRWSGRLTPLPAQRLDELGEPAEQRIDETRDRINTMLETPDTDAVGLAAVYGRLGALYAAHRLYAGAEIALANARLLDPSGFQWAYYAAHIALEQGEPARALDDLAAATHIDPDYPTLPLRRGEALLALNRLDAARAAFAQAVDVPGLRAAALYGIGQIDLLRRDFGEAAKALDEVLVLQPQADAVHYPLGQALLQLDRRDAAREHLARRGTVKPSHDDPLVDALRSLQVGARFHFEQGVAAVKRRDYAAAAEAFAAGLAEAPDNVRARTSYARALWLAGRPDAARAELQSAVAAAGDETLPRFLLAVVQEAAGEEAAATANYRAVLATDREHPGALSYLASLHLRSGRYADAAALYARAIAAGVAQMPVFLHYWSALSQTDTGDARLRDRLIEFDRRFPEPPIFRYLLGRLLVTSTDTNVRDVGRALEIAGSLQHAQPNALHGELLALALAANGEFAEAAEVQSQLVEMARLSGAWIQAAMLEQTADRYQAGRLAEISPAVPGSILVPPPPDPDAAMRNYPAGRPY